MLGRFRRGPVRRISFVILAAITVFTLEPVMGVVRDGAVHHETSARAAAHSFLAGAGHAHGTIESDRADDSGQRHEHGSSADHCSHAHGLALVGTFVFEIGTTETLLSFDEAARNPMHTPTALTHPPRA